MGMNGKIEPDCQTGSLYNGGSIPPISTSLSEEDCENLEQAKASLAEANDYVEQVHGVPANGISVMIKSLIARVERLMEKDNDAA